MPEKEYTFQCIISYKAENEEEARLILQDDLKHNGNSLFNCIQVIEKRCCNNCGHFNKQASTCSEGGFSEIGDPDREFSEYDCSGFKGAVTRRG